MTQTYNTTPFPHFCFSNTDNQGREFGVFMVKAAFDIGDEGACTVSDDQEPFSFTDQCHGEVNVSSVRLPSDLVSYKPRADLVVDGSAHSPGGRPSPFWLAGIRVLSGERLLAARRLRVTGPRHWLPQWRRELSLEQQRDWKAHRHFFKGWTLSEPDPVTSVPIRYELAYGGAIGKGEDEDGERIMEAYEYNPIGCGWLDREWSDHTQSHQAPRIEIPDEPVVEPCPAGFQDG